MSTKENPVETEQQQQPQQSRGIFQIFPKSGIRSRSAVPSVCSPIVTACGIICCLIIIIIVILAVIAGVNVNACNKLSKSVDINSVTPSVYNYDPNTFPTLNFVSFNSIMTKTGQIFVTQSNSTTDTNAVVSVRIASTKDEIATVKDENVESTKRISIERSDTFKGALAWIGYLSLPPRCILAKVDVVLPQKIPSIVSIDTDVNDIIFSGNSVPYSSQINATTLSGEIDVNNLSVGSLILNTKNGPIKGSISGIVNQLIATTTNGKIQLNVVVGSNANPKIEITNTIGDIQLGFNSSFSGSYDTKTDNGKINTINTSSATTNEDRNKIGKVGDRNGTLVANTKSGNIDITF